MTDSLLASGREVFRNVARAPNGLSNKHLVLRPYYLGIFLFAGHGGRGVVTWRMTRTEVVLLFAVGLCTQST